MGTLDTDLQREVLKELRANRTIHPKRMTVSVVGGIVTLTGVAETLEQSEAAERIALGVRGVIDVVNHSSVNVPGEHGHSDTNIAHAVRRALIWNVLVPDDEIASSVEGGVVTLTGRVADATEQDEAARSIGRLPGVRGVINLISVGAPEHRRDARRPAVA
jgi:osmotically-inducible protein OsmY